MNLKLPKIKEGGITPRSIVRGEQLPNRFTRNHARHQSLNNSKFLAQSKTPIVPLN